MLIRFIRENVELLKSTFVEEILFPSRQRPPWDDQEYFNCLRNPIVLIIEKILAMTYDKFYKESNVSVNLSLCIEKKKKRNKWE